MRGMIACVVVGVGLLLPISPAGAHHSFAATYDANKPLTLKGTVTKVELINPHSWIWVDVKMPDGSVINWGFEGGSPNSLIKNGVTKNTLPTGSEIIVTAFQAKNGENKAVGVSMTFSDGRKLFFGGSAPGSQGPAAAPSPGQAAN